MGKVIGKQMAGGVRRRMRIQMARGEIWMLIVGGRAGMLMARVRVLILTKIKIQACKRQRGLSLLAWRVRATKTNR